MSRIREYWVRSQAASPATSDTDANNDESVALGVARTARVITAAALVMSISFAGLIAAHVQFMRMFGVGMTLAVVVDATLVRLVLVPAFMKVMGRWNWWAPKPLARLHQRFGINEGGTAATHPAQPNPRQPERDPHPANTATAGRHRATVEHSSHPAVVADKRTQFDVNGRSHNGPVSTGVLRPYGALTAPNRR
jgi:putative drug exporter of the RND superfamily